MNLFQRLKIAALVLWGDDLAVAVARVAPTADELARIADGLAHNTMKALYDAQAESRRSWERMEQLHEGVLDEVRRQTEATNDMSARMTTLEQHVVGQASRITAMQQRITLVDERLLRGDQKFDVIELRLQQLSAAAD